MEFFGIYIDPQTSRTGNDSGTNLLPLHSNPVFLKLFCSNRKGRIDFTNLNESSMKKGKRHSGLAARPIANVPKRGGMVSPEEVAAGPGMHGTGSGNREHVIKMAFLVSETFLRLVFIIVRAIIDG